MTNKSISLAELFGEPIHIYTRAQALEDGNLIDVSETAREAGIRYPVALTLSAWSAYVAVPPGVVGQDEAGRLWDILWMFSLAARRAAGALLAFELYVRNDNRKPRRVQLKAICGPGDAGEPVITIMLPEED